MEENKQLAFPFEDLLGNVAFSDDYNFETLKKIFLPNNPLTNFPLFLTTGSKIVNESRKRFIHIYMKEKEEKEAPDMKPDKLIYKIGNFQIKADERFGLPDEFDGLVWDCITMLISKVYINKDKIFKGYRISEGIIMQELVKRGLFKKSGVLLKRIKYSLLRMKQTSYEIKSETSKGKKSIDFNEIYYSLIDTVLRKGTIYEDADGSTNEISQTIIIPSNAILSSLAEKEYHIIANEVRYKLTRYLTKSMHDRFFRTIVKKILDNEISINTASNSYPNFIIGYDKFCDWTGIIPLEIDEQRVSKITNELKKNYFDDLIRNKVIDSFHVEKKKSKNEEFNVIFLFNSEFIDSVFSILKNKLEAVSIKNVNKESLSAYYSKLERQIQSTDIKNEIKSGPQKVISHS